MRLDRPVPRDKMWGLITLIAITFAVLSVVTVGPTRAHLGRATVPQPAPARTTR